MNRLKRIYKNIRYITAYVGRRQIPTIAASGAFWFFLSLVPLVIMTVSLLPYTSVTQEQLMAVIVMVMPDSLIELLDNILMDVYASHSAVLSISLLVTVWSAAQGFSALIRGLEVVYEQTDRAGYFHRRFRGIVYLVLLLASILLAIILMGLGRIILDMLTDYLPMLADFFAFLARFRYLPVVCFLTLAFAVIYRWGPTLDEPFTWQLPGAFLSAVGWSIFSWIFSTYVRMTGGYGTYGSLSTVVAVMLWLYYCMTILLYGAVFNVALARYKKQRDGI